MYLALHLESRLGGPFGQLLVFSHPILLGGQGSSHWCVCVWGGGIAAPHGVSGEAKMTPRILLVVKLGSRGRPEDLLSWVGGKTLAG